MSSEAENRRFLRKFANSCFFWILKNLVLATAGFWLFFYLNVVIVDIYVFKKYVNHCKSFEKDLKWCNCLFLLWKGQLPECKFFRDTMIKTSNKKHLKTLRISNLKFSSIYIWTIHPQKTKIKFQNPLNNTIILVWINATKFVNNPLGDHLI